MILIYFSIFHFTVHPTLNFILISKPFEFVLVIRRYSLDFFIDPLHPLLCNVSIIISQREWSELVEFSYSKWKKIKLKIIQSREIEIYDGESVSAALAEDSTHFQLGFSLLGWCKSSWENLGMFFVGEFLSPATQRGSTAASCAVHRHETWNFNDAYQSEDGLNVSTLKSRRFIHDTTNTSQPMASDNLLFTDSTRLLERVVISLFT